MKSPPVLEVDALTVLRDRQRLVSDVSLEVVAGSIHLLIGPNGAGKSTLFAAVVGLIDFAGTIRLHWRRSGRIGYVPQFFSVDRTLPLTAGEFLAMSRQRRPVCLGLSRAMRRKADDLLAGVGLAGIENRPLGALSGGELRRVLLANALDPIPELLLLDEPSTGLDEASVRQLEKTLVELRNSAGTAVLMVSHDLAQARRVADHATIIDRQVRRSGPAAKILSGDLATMLDLGSGGITS